MASGYTPGLTVSPRTTIVKTRRLPLKGEVLVSENDWVLPEQAVAQANLPGIMQTVKVASRLGVDASEVPELLTIKIGDRVAKGDLIAQTKGLFGKFFIAEARASTSGVIEIISPISGNVGIREAPTPVTISAYIPGKITQVLEGEGVQITAHGALIQGIFGIGGERRAPLMMVSQSPDQPLTEADITADLGRKSDRRRLEYLRRSATQGRRYGRDWNCRRGHHRQRYGRLPWLRYRGGDHRA